MKIGIVGKGGVGKTTISSLIAENYHRRSRRVIAIDTDSNPNLGISLGLTLEETESIPVLPRSVIVGNGSGITPDELVRTYGRSTPSGVTLLSAIKVTEAGAGCTCGGHLTVRNLLGSAIETQADITIVDMEAGIEHLSRSGGTLAHVDVLLVIAEPSHKAIVTAARTVPLAEELGISNIYVVGSKAVLPGDTTFFADRCKEIGIQLAGVVPFDQAVRNADRDGVSLAATVGTPVREAIESVVEFLERTVSLNV